MSTNPKTTKKTATIADQFTFQKVPNHFEQDTHIHVQGLEIHKVHVLAGETPEKDIIVVEYKESPNLSFYDAEGKLVDIDHYLPCLLYTSPSPRDGLLSRMPSSA